MSLKLDIVLSLNGTDSVASGLGNVGAKVESVGVRAKKSGQDLADGMSGVGAQLQRMQGFLLGFVAFDQLTHYAGKAIQMADGWALLNAKLEVATGSAAAAQASMAGLYGLAQELRVPLSETATLFGRLTPALREFGGGTAEAMRMTEALSLSLKVSGATQAEAGSAMLQFSQAMSAGALRGEEFNSMADAAPRLLQALADGLGVSRGALKGMAEEGKLTTDAVYEALSKQLPKLKDEFGQLPVTVGDSWTRLGNVALKTIGELNQGGGFTEALARGINAVADALPNVITTIQLSFVALLAGIQKGWVNLKYAADVAWEGLKFGFLSVFIETSKQYFAGFLKVIGDGLALVGADTWAAKFEGWGTALEKPIYSAEQFNNKLSALGDTREKEIAAIDETAIGLFEEALSRDKNAAATQQQDKASDTLNKTTGLTAKESEKLDGQFTKLAKSLANQTASLQRTSTGQKQLTATQELTAKASEFLTKMGDQLTASQKQQLQAFIQNLPALEKQSEATTKLTKAREEHKRKLDESLQSLTADLQKAIEERDSLGKTEIQVREVAVARDKETLALLKARAAKEGHTQVLGDEIQVVKQRIAEGEKLVAVLKDTEGWKAQNEQIEKNAETWNTFSSDIGKAFSDGFQRMLEDGKGGWDSFTDSIKNTFKRTVVDFMYRSLAEPMVLKLSTALGDTSAKSSNSGMGMLGGAGVWGMVAVGAIAAASAWNKSQDEKYKHLTAEYRQSTQSTGGVLGYADAKSESLNKSLDRLAKVAGDTLDVNYGMYAALLAIKEGIGGAAAGFSRTIGMTNGNIVGGIKTGSSTFDNGYGRFGEGKVVATGLAGLDDDMVSGFLNGLANKVSSAIYNKKTKVIDAGIEFGRQALADVIAAGSVEAFNYANVQTTKKVLGVKTSVKVKTETSDLDDVLKKQFAEIFSGAGDVLSLAAVAFGVDVDSYIKKLVIAPQQLSLKDLKGDELTKELEAFFSSQLDGWAGLLVGGTDTLLEFQEIGEGAFETVIRLAGEINVFNNYVSKLNLNFKQTGLDAVRASQAIADASGGFDQLSKNLSSYYENFFTEAERFDDSWNSLSDHIKELGFDVVPKTREQFRALVDAQDLSTDAGQRQFAALVAVSGAFADLVPETVAMLDLTEHRFGDFVTTLGANWETAFGVMGNASMTARQKLIDFSGGIDALSEKIGFYYENFYSDSEKNARVFAELDAKFDMLGVTVELNKDSFRELIESIDLAVDPERYAALLDIAPVFAQLLGKLGDAAGQTIGTGVNATGVSDQQLASINQGAESWWQTYQPEFKAQTDQATKTADAIVQLTSITESSSEKIRAEVANANTALIAVINDVSALDDSNNAAVISSIEQMSRQTVSAVENAVMSNTRQ